MTGNILVELNKIVYTYIFIDIHCFYTDFIAFVDIDSSSDEISFDVGTKAQYSGFSSRNHCMADEHCVE